jgi:tetratricopeptide (TPR) repeat protein
MDDVSSRSEPADAREALARFVELVAEGHEVSFEEYCARFPALEGEMRALYRDWRAVSSLLGRWGQEPLSERLVRRFGAGSLRDLNLQREAQPPPEEVFEGLYRTLRLKREGFGRYRVKDEVGQGGMGVVLRVWDDELKRHLAMKLIRGGDGTPREGAADASTVGRFLDEARSERRSSAGTPGSPLVTQGGHAIGTPAYMSPEQARGDLGAMGPHSDVYSMGAILYHLLAGRVPYGEPGRGLEAHQVRARVLRGPPAPVQALSPRQPAELVAICEKAMARELRERYPSVLELAEDLRAFLEHRVVKAHRTGAIVELRKWVERNRAFTGAVAAAFLALVVGAVSSSRMAVRAAESEFRQRAAELVPRLQALDEVESSRDKTRQMNEYSAAAEEVADLFAAWGVPLDGTQDVAALARAMNALEPMVRDALVGGLYQIIRQIGLAGLGQASHYYHEGGAPAGKEADWRLMAENHLRLVRIWPRALRLLETLQDQPWGVRAMRAFERFLVRRSAELELHDDWMESATPYELDFVSFVGHVIGKAERETLEAALAHDPTGFWLHARRGLLALQEEDHVTARTHLTCAVALRPRSRTARSNLGYAMKKLGDVHGASILLRAVIEDDPDNFAATFNLASLLTNHELGPLDEAIGLLRRIHPLTPGDPDVLHVLGLALDKHAVITGDLSIIKEEIDAFQHWTELEPDSWEPFYWLGLAYQLREDHAQALVHLDQASTLQPANEDVIYARIDSLWELGRREEALETCIWALEEGDRPKILQLYGELAETIEGPDQRAPHEELLKTFRSSR